MKKWKLWLGIVFVFLSGLVTGSVSTKLYTKQKFAGTWRKGPAAARKLIVGRLTNEIDLTKNQQIEVEKIVGEAQSRWHKIRMQLQPEIDEIVETCVVQMKTKLSAEQQKKLDIIHERVKKKWHTPEQ